MFPHSYHEQKPKETQMEGDMSHGVGAGLWVILLCFQCGSVFSGKSDLCDSDGSNNRAPVTDAANWIRHQGRACGLGTTWEWNVQGKAEPGLCPHSRKGGRRVELESRGPGGNPDLPEACGAT